MVGGLIGEKVNAGNYWIVGVEPTMYDISTTEPDILTMNTEKSL